MVADPTPKKPPEGAVLIHTDHARNAAVDRSISDNEIMRTVFEPTRTSPGRKRGRTIAERGFPAGYVIKAVYDVESTAEAMERLAPGEDVVGLPDTAVVLVTVFKVRRRWRIRTP